MNNLRGYVLDAQGVFGILIPGAIALFVTRSDYSFIALWAGNASQFDWTESVSFLFGSIVLGIVVHTFSAVLENWWWKFTLPIATFWSPGSQWFSDIRRRGEQIHRAQLGEDVDLITLARSVRSQIARTDSHLQRGFDQSQAFAALFRGLAFVALGVLAVNVLRLDALKVLESLVTLLLTLVVFARLRLVTYVSMYEWLIALDHGLDAGKGRETLASE